MRRLIVAPLAALVLVGAACTSEGDREAGPDDPGAATQDDPELETTPLPGTPATSPPAPGDRPSAAAPQRTVTIARPADGDAVTSPVVLEVEVDGFALGPIDGSFEDDRGHLYAYVDIPPPTAQERIPEEEGIVGFSGPRVELPLEPGEHTVTVVAAHGYPVPMMPIVSDEVTVTVE